MSNFSIELEKQGINRWQVKDSIKIEQLKKSIKHNLSYSTFLAVCENLLINNLIDLEEYIMYRFWFIDIKKGLI